MKKIMMLVVVAVLMLGVSGQAMAYFTDDELIRVVYSTINGTGQEFATDLGNFSNLTDPSKLTAPVTISTGNFTPGSVGQTDFTNMKIAYFIVSLTANSGAGAAWSSGALTNSGIMFANSFSAFAGAAEIPMALWNSKGTQTASNPQGDASSYWNNANNGGTGIGSMGVSINATQHNGVESYLTALNTSSYVDQYLYYYGSNPDAGGQGTAVAILRTNADGSTTLMQANAVPIPAAVYLFGSGLLGMFGLRRKMVA